MRYFTNTYKFIGASFLHDKFLKIRKSDKVKSFVEYRKMFIVNNISNYHWSFYCVFFESKIIAYYDSFNEKSTRCGEILTLLEEFTKLNKESFDKTEWKCLDMPCFKQVSLLLHQYILVLFLISVHTNGLGGR